MESVETDPEVDSIDTAAVAAAVAPSTRTSKMSKDGIPVDIDKIMDSAFEEMDSGLRERAGFKPKDKEQPKDVKAETQVEADAPLVDEGEPAKAEKPKEEPDHAMERAFVGFRYAKVPESVTDAMMRNPEGRAQLRTWGNELRDGQIKADEKLRSAAETAKAEKPKGEATEKEADVSADIPDFSTALQAFDQYGEDFKKPLGEFGRVISTAASKAARESFMAEIQPAAGVLTEMSGLMREMLERDMRREVGERFPKLVEGKDGFEKVQAGFKRLWGTGGESYAEAAPTRLGQLQAAYMDAARLLQSESEGSRKDDSLKKTQRIPPAPSRQLPRKVATTQDEIMDETFAETAKRFTELSKQQ